MVSEFSKDKCCGCGACSEICGRGAIAMKPDDKGFLYPIIDKGLCVGCGLCDKICAMNNTHQSSKTVKNSFALQHFDKNVLYGSSSGGAFTAVSDKILNNDGLAFGSVFDKNTLDVKHICADNTVLRDRMRGSKYVQSSTTGVFSEIKKQLNSGREVLFTGTPCQCAELIHFLGEKPNNLFIIDLLCHGAPSPKVLKKHIELFEKKYNKKTVDFSYRSKKYGYNHTLSISFSDGTEKSSVNLKRLLKLYTLNMRESCYACPYASKHRYGDITIGDLWETGKIANIHNCLGTSLVFTNTEKGEIMLEGLKDCCNIFPVDVSKLYIGAMNNPVKKSNRVDLFWQDFDKYGYEYALNKYAPKTMKSTVYQYFLRVLSILHLDKIYSRIKG